MFLANDTFGIPDVDTVAESIYPPAFVCPIARTLMVDPMLALCGHAFDRPAIEWLLTSPNHAHECPVCGAPIFEKDVWRYVAITPCAPLKQAIGEFLNARTADGLLVQPSGQPRSVETLVKKSRSFSASVRGLFSLGKGSSKQRHSKQLSTSAERRDDRHVSTGSADNMETSPIWARLVPLIYTVEPVDITSDELTLGRNSSCNVPFGHTELSSIHCVILRIENGDGEYRYFIEDRSTNGTYLNGSRISKGTRVPLVSGDELSLAERYSSKLTPKIESFVDWVFDDVECTTAAETDIQLVKKSLAFSELVQMNSNALCDLGVKTSTVREKLLAATGHWLDKYRFPAYRFELVKQVAKVTPAPNTPSSGKSSPQVSRKIIRKSKSRLNISQSDDSLNVERQQEAQAGPPVLKAVNMIPPIFQTNAGMQAEHAMPPSSSTANDIAEINFWPASMAEQAKTGCVTIRLRRSKAVQSQAVALVRSTDLGSAQEMLHYVPLDKRVVFAPGIAEMAINFYWNTDEIPAEGVTVSFELSILQGKALPGDAATAMLTIDNPVNNAGRRASRGNIPTQKPQATVPPIQVRALLVSKLPDADSAGSLEAQLPSMTIAPAALESEPGAIRPHNENKITDATTEKKSSHGKPAGKGHGRSPIRSRKRAPQFSRKIPPADELNQDAGKLWGANERIIDESPPVTQVPEPATLANNSLIGSSPVEMPALPSVSASGAMAGGSLGATPVANQTRLPSDTQRVLYDDKTIASSQEILDAAAMPVVAGQVPSANRKLASSASCESLTNSSKDIQTITRAELDGFLLAAFLALVRKIAASEDFPMNLAHRRSPLVTVASELKDLFSGGALRNLQPLKRANDNNFAEDIFDVGAVTATFKRSVTDNQVPIRERTQVALIGADATQKGLHYDVAECTSPSHVYSENVYVVVEDLVQYAGLGSDTCATTSLFAVFDGHGGRMISEYLSFHLPLNIARQPKFSSDIEAAILSAFASTDEGVIKRIRRDGLRGGSTAVTALVRDAVLYVAWAGDARCILFQRDATGTKLAAVPLVAPHNAFGAEKERVEKAGGRVDFASGKWRVNGRLAVTRSFGDVALKPMVSAVPEIVRRRISANDALLLLSCDGIFDVMENFEVAQFLEERRGKLPLKQLTADLVAEAVRRGGADDITVVLAELDVK